RNHEVSDQGNKDHYYTCSKHEPKDYISTIPDEKSLYEHLMDQAAFVFDPTQIKIAKEIIGNLDEKGFLTSIPIDLLSNYTPEIIEDVIKQIQHLDPLGICAKDVKECLKIQLISQKKEHTLCYTILNEYYDLLLLQKFKEIEKKLGICSEEIKRQIKKDLSHLDPFPGLRFGKCQNQPIIPDIILQRKNGTFDILINDSMIPKFHVQKHYTENYTSLTNEEKKYVDKNLNSASWIINAIKKRNKTLTDIVKYIIKKQSIFFTLERKELLPMTISEIAKELEMTESTIARAVNQKYIYCSQGCFSLKSFFSSSTNKTSNTHSSYSAKQLLIQILQKENKNNPLSDIELMHKLKEQGVECSRRTVTKYRESLSIAPSSRRKI
ncbi:MAG: RNA polymerase factor sigma-54, partial [Chlamydiae bacterium]|nr:RNA polymerase factor sigma-54 [Chlamydiota bacterium]